MIREGLSSGKFSLPEKVVDRSVDIPEEKPWSFWNLFSRLKFWA
jgi:hypothetical protein